jgi:hypothetical protein
MSKKESNIEGYAMLEMPDRLLVPMEVGAQIMVLLQRAQTLKYSSEVNNYIVDHAPSEYNVPRLKLLPPAVVATMHVLADSE